MQGGVGHEGGGAGASVCVGSSRAVGCPGLSCAGIVLPTYADGSWHRQRFSEAQVRSRALGAVGACERIRCLLSVVHPLGHVVAHPAVDSGKTHRAPAVSRALWGAGERNR